jgi:hypothetical protein
MTAHPVRLLHRLAMRGKDLSLMAPSLAGEKWESGRLASLLNTAPRLVRKSSG